MIRIAHVWSTDMGLALSLPHMQRYLDRGWEVYGITPPGPRIPDLQRVGVKWLPHPIERKINAKTDWDGCRVLYRCFREKQFHIVHGHNAKTGILARAIAALARVPVIVHTHHGLIYSLDSPPVLKFGGAALERVASEVSHRIFVQSEDDYRTLLKTHGAPERVLELIGNGVDLNVFNPRRFNQAARTAIRRELGVADHEVLFFSAGRLVREKGFLELFEAVEFASRVNPSIRLAVAGPEDTERNLGIDRDTLDRARQSGVLLLGERKEMAPLYAACDVVVLASWREGIARVLMEGAAMGKPLLASDARGCGLVVQPGWGFLVPMRNATELAGAIQQLAGDAELRRRIAEHNLLEAPKRYDLRIVLDRVENAYLELLRARGIDDQSKNAETMARHT